MLWMAVIRYLPKVTWKSSVKNENGNPGLVEKSPLQYTQSYPSSSSCCFPAKPFPPGLWALVLPPGAQWFNEKVLGQKGLVTLSFRPRAVCRTNASYRQFKGSVLGCEGAFWAGFTINFFKLLFEFCQNGKGSRAMRTAVVLHWIQWRRHLPVLPQQLRSDSRVLFEFPLSLWNTTGWRLDIKSNCVSIHADASLFRWIY